MDKPKARQSYTDPAFGTRVTRVTDAPSGTAHRTLYSTVQPWNADESLLVLYHAGGKDAGHHLYDGQTYKYIRPLEISPADIEEVYWDESDSSSLYYIQRKPTNDEFFGKLVKYDVNTRKRRLVANLEPICGKPASRRGLTVRGGNDIQGIADDKIGLRCVNDEINGKSADITFLVDVKTGKTSPRVDLDPAKAQGSNSFGFAPDVAVSPLLSGKHVVIQDSVFDSDMNFLYAMDGSLDKYTASNGRTYDVPKTEHSTTGQMPNGNDAVFSPRFDPARNGCDGDSEDGQGSLVALDVQGGSCRVVVGMSTGWGYPLSGTHLSAVSRQNPGWVTMTSVGARQLDYLTNGRPAPVLFNELSLSYTDPDNPTTCRLAHVRTMGGAAKRGSSYGGAYFGEPHAVMSPSGSRILFNSDWYDSGSVDTYAVNLGKRDTTNTTTGNTQIATTTTNTPAPVTSTPDYRLKAQVRMEGDVPRVYVDYVNPNHGRSDRIRIGRAGTRDKHYVMWLYTNGTQKKGVRGSEIGRLDFLRKYIGQGNFEARLFVDGNLETAVERVPFYIPW